MDSKEPMGDDELSAVLRKWEVDGAPSSLEARIFEARPRIRWWRPVAAVAFALAVAAAAGVWFLKAPRPAVQVAVTPMPVPSILAIPKSPPAPSTPALPRKPKQETAPAHQEETHVDFSWGGNQALSLAAKPESQGGQLQFQLSPDAPLPPRVYRIGNGVGAPSILEKHEPQYSDEARMAKLAGTSAISLVVNESGSAQDIHVTRSLGLGLDEKAIEAIGQWKFKPGMKDGMPVAVAATVEVNFHLDQLPIWRPTSARFTVPDGASRPVLLDAPYPADLGSNLNDSVAVSFDVDDNGIPINLRAQSLAGPKLESEAIAIVSGWRFKPGMNGGKPISVPASFDFIHGTTAAPGTSPIRVGGQVQAANLIRKITPPYPREAKASHTQGTVKLQVRIDRDGHVSEATVLSGDPVLASAAIDAVKQWLYRPTLINGNAVEVDTEVDVNFSLLQ